MIQEITKLKDGWYLFRERPGRLWRATKVQDGMASGKWIDGELLVETECHGEFWGPLSEDKPLLVIAQVGSGGALPLIGVQPTSKVTIIS